MKFASVMIGTLNTILLTSPELYDLRTQLRDVEKQVINNITLFYFYKFNCILIGRNYNNCHSMAHFKLCKLCPKFF